MGLNNEMGFSGLIENLEEFDIWWKSMVIQSDPHELPKDLNNFRGYLRTEMGIDRAEVEMIGWNGVYRLIFLANQTAMKIYYPMNTYRTKAELKKLKKKIESFSDEDIKRKMGLKNIERREHLKLLNKTEVINEKTKNKTFK